MDIFVIILAWIAGFFFGYWRGLHKLAENMLKDPDNFARLIQQVKKAREEAKLEDDMANDRETVIDVEREQNQYYAYATTGEFLAQGQDFRSMFETIKKRFPGRSFRINKTNSKLTDEETGLLIKAVFETFGDRAQDQSNQKS